MEGENKMNGAKKFAYGVVCVPSGVIESKCIRTGVRLMAAAVKDDVWR